MTNLLKETIQDIESSGHSIEDIDFIGSFSGEYGVSFSEFQKLADREYDNGWGSENVARDLVVLFSDGSYLNRWEYDGSEGWGYVTTPVPAAVQKPISNLIRREGDYFDMNVADLSKSIEERDDEGI